MGRTINTTRGTDVGFQFNWPDGLGGNADLTGFTVRPFEVDEDTAFVPAVTFLDEATGLIDVEIPWDDAMPDRSLSFRIQIQNASGLDIATLKILVIYQ